MTTRQYSVPDSISAQCDQVKYYRWLQRKASAHVKRDRKRNIACTIARYKAEIHAAVCESEGKDFYTGERLNWSLISTYDNAASQNGRAKYKKTLALLPTVDHTTGEDGRPRFVICAWYVNDVKSDLTLDDFYQLCEQILKHRDQH